MPTAVKRYDVIFAGNYTKDTIITPGGTRLVDGGGMNYAAHAAQSLGVRAAVVTRLAQEDHQVVENIRAAGIDCYPTYSPHSTLMTLEYPTQDVDRRDLYVTHTAGTILPAQLDGLAARAVAVSPSLRGEVEPSFFEIIRNREGILLAADVQGFVRVLRGESLVYEAWDEMGAVLPNLDILKSDAVEAQYLTGASDIEKAARFFQSMGAREVILTHKDGVLISAGGENHHFQFHSQSLEGRSGRGDTCMGSYVAMRLGQPPREAGMWAAAVTSLKVERPGVFNRPVREVEEFIGKYYA